MNTHQGYSKKTLDSTYLLRADGGESAFHWNGQSGLPSWLWGGNSQHNYYVYNPSNFNVDKVDSHHAINGRLYQYSHSTTYSTTNAAWYMLLRFSAYSRPNNIHIETSYNNRVTEADMWSNGFSYGYLFKDNNQNGGNIAGVCFRNVRVSDSNPYCEIWFKMNAISDSSSGHYSPSSSATVNVYCDTKDFTIVTLASDPGVTWKYGPLLINYDTNYGWFHHADHDNNDSVLLAGGSYKALSDFSMAHSHPYLYSTQVSAAQDNITWAQGIANAAATRRAFIYNTNSAEWSYLFGFSSNGTNATYGAVLKMGYTDRYLRILRVNGGTWQSTDWEKIYAGYADSAGNADTLDGYHANGLFTDFKYNGNSLVTATIGGTTKTANVVGSYRSGGYSSMNAVAALGNCMGMTQLSGTDSTVNPNAQTNWHHFINISYNEESSNMWQTQFAIKAGTTDVWVRSRKGGTVTDGTAWVAPWVRLAKYPEVVTELGTSGNYLTWTKNGTVNNITIPYASYAGNSDKLDGYHLSELYWANIKVLTSSNTGTYPTFDSANINRNKIVSSQTSGVGPIIPAIALKGAGYPVYTDPEFSGSVNSVSAYNNSGGGTVTVTRLADDQSSGNSSGYILKIQTTGTASPGLGGFYQGISSRANAVFAQIFRAKIPTGYSVVNAENSMGTGYSTFWLTDTAGTGKWEWYIRITECGPSGTFSSGGHVYLTGSPSTVTWYLSYCNCIDLTKGNYDGLRTRYSDYSSSAGNADTVDGYHANGLFTAFGNTATGNTPTSITATIGGTTKTVQVNWADYAKLPYGFSSWTSGASWGNTTGTSFASWNDSTGGSIDFRRDNPSSGKMSIKVDGRVYVNEGTNPVLSSAIGSGTGSSDYWGIRTPDGGDTWIRTSTYGFLPYTSGSAGSGHSSLGTSSWYFSTAYIDNIYGTLNGTATKVSHAISFKNTSNTTVSYDGSAAVDLTGGLYYSKYSDFTTSLGRYQQTITVSGDSSNYYPVVITLSGDKNFPHYISIWKNLGSTTASYSGNHSNGTSSMWLQYECRSMVWDGNGGYIRTLYKSMPYANLCADASYVYSSVGVLCVWLRGGGTTYEIALNYDGTVKVYYSSTNLGSSSYPANVAPTTSIGNGGIYNTTYSYYNADAVDDLHFTYSNSSNSPTYLWATDSNGSSYLASRTGMTIGNADKLDGYHLSDLYWANLNVQTSSSSTTYPTFGDLAVINNSSDTSYDAMVYLENKSNADWAMIINTTTSYTYGLDIRSGGAYALRVINGYSRLIGSTIIGADSTPSYTLDVRGSERIYSTYPQLRIENSSGGTAETSVYISNGTAGWALGVNPWGVGGGVFAIGQYSGTGSSTWRFKIDNNGYCYTSSYLNLGGGNEKNASSPPYVWGVNGSDNYLRTYATGSLSVNYANYSGYANKLKLVPSGTAIGGTAGTWSTILSNSDPMYFKVYEVYNDNGPSTYGEVLNATGYTNHWQALLWMGAGDGGRLYYRNKNYNTNSWGSWYTVAWTSDIPTVTNYYWANMSVLSSSSTSTTPLFGYIGVGNAVDSTYAIKATGRIASTQWLHANLDGSSTNGGLTLYSTSAEYAVLFRGTGDQGTHDAVSGDWATYFTMNSGGTSRGWIFRRYGSANVASISGSGQFSSNNYRLWGSSAPVNCNDVTYTGISYYTSNGPSGIGNYTTDGALYSEAYSTSWVALIAQDYRDGNLYIRGKNSGSWTSWHPVLSTINAYPKWHYGSTSTPSTYCKISILSYTSWMLYFKVRIYQGYNYYDIDFSGYNYGGNYWYSPKCKLVSSNYPTITVYFGYDSAYHLWVAFPTSSYIGVDVVDCVNGYTQISTSDIKNLFNISFVSSLSTIQSTQTAENRSAYSDYATYANNVYVSQHTTNDVNYPIVWSNQNNTSSTWGQQLYKSYDNLIYNPANRRLQSGTLELFPTTSNWSEGIRIHSASNSWTTLILCGTDNTGHTGTSANSWSMHTYGGNFYLNRNNSSSHTGYELCNVSGNWGIATVSPAYKLDVAGDIGTTGNLYIRHSTNNTMTYSTTNPRIVFSESGSLAVGIVYTDYDSYRASKGLKIMDVDNSDAGNVWLEIQGKTYGPGFVHTSVASDSYVLLAGGGYKALSDFSMSGHNHDGRYLQYEGWWTSSDSHSVDNACGMVFSYTSHGAPGSWGTTVTFEYLRNASYRLQLHGTGTNALYFRNKSSDYGLKGWLQVRSSEDTYVSNNKGYIGGTEITQVANSTYATYAYYPYVENTDSNVTLYMNFSYQGSRWRRIYTTGGIYCNPSTDYVYASSFVASDWFRSTGSTGWYNSSYQGGWYMADADWIRSYNSKPVKIAIGTNNAWGIGGHRLALDLYGSSHVSLLLRNTSNAWGICSNSNGNMYIGYRPSDSDTNTSSDSYKFRLSNDATIYFNNSTSTYISPTYYTGTAAYSNNSDKVDGLHACRFTYNYNNANDGDSSSVTVNNMAADSNSNSHVGMIYASTDNPTGGSSWVHVWSQTWSRGVISSWCSLIALGVSNGTGMWYRTYSGALTGRAWTRVCDASNTYVTLSSTASTVTINGNTVGNSTYKIGYANYANSAGNADTVDGYHAASFFRHCGWNSSSSYTSADSTDLPFGLIINQQGNATSSISGYPTNYGFLLNFGGGGSTYTGIQIYGSSGNTYQIRDRWSSSSWNSWLDLITSANIGSQSVNYATYSSYPYIVATNANDTFYIDFSYYGNTYRLIYVDPNLYYNPSTNYMYGGSFQASNWFRSTGSTGWYSLDYGGGWYMSDSTWIRSYGSKNIYQDTGITRTDGQFLVGASGTYFYANNSGNGYFSSHLGVAGVNTTYPLYVAGDAYCTGWARAGSGFYCQGTGVHYTYNTNSTTVGEIDITSNNEFCMSTSDSTNHYMYINYRSPCRGNTIYKYIWNAGNSSNYARHEARQFIGHTTASSWLGGQQNNTNAAFNVVGGAGAGSYWPWMRGEDSSTGYMFSMGVYSTAFYLMASTTSRSSNGYDVVMYFMATNGLLYTSGGFSTPGSATAAGGFYTGSDINLKKNIKRISESIYQYEWKNGAEGTQYGFIAQILEKEYPSLVLDDGKIKTVNYNGALSMVIAKLENRAKSIENMFYDEENETIDYTTISTIKDDVSTLKEKLEKAEERITELENKLKES